MSDCGSWNPVSLQDPQPYYPDEQLPTVAELLAMDVKSFNMWRTKAKKIWLSAWQKRWRYKGLTDDEENQLQALFRTGRTAIFGDEETHPEDYGCGSSNHKKHWELSINWRESINASLPQWYVERFGLPM